MFDVGFSEIVVIAVVALIVIGPERLPKVARTLGHLFGRMQRYVNDVKADISREMELDELRKLQATVQEAARDIEHSVKKEINATETELNSIANSAADAMKPAPEGNSSATSPAAIPAAELRRRLPHSSSWGSIIRERASRLHDRPATGKAVSRMNSQDTFISHLVELRDRLLRAIIAVLVVFLCLFPWAETVYVDGPASCLQCCRRAAR